MKTLRISGIEPESIVDGPGIRYVVFVQGCPHHCEGCHNPQTHDFEGGHDVEAEAILKEIEANPLLRGVTFSGGEPFCQAEALAELGKAIKERGLHLACYTGYVFEELLRRSEKEVGIKALLSVTDLLIDGPFVQEEKSLAVRFRGSKNQRILDLPASIKAGCAILDPMS